MPATPAATLVDHPVDESANADGAVRSAVIDEILAACADEHTAQLRQLWMALQWAHLHPAEVDADGVVTDYAGWGDPALLVPDVPGRIVTPLTPLAGPGAPLVSPLAPLELGAALDRSHDHARQLLGDALELAHRLPRLWRLTQEGRVPVWVARRISRETHDLSFEAVTHADQLICAVPDKVRQVDAARLIHEARLHVDPDRAMADGEAAAARRGVWLRRDGRAPGVTDVNMTLDADDADLLDATLNRVAADLRGLGDTTSRDERRATAVGILADPQHALDLMSGRTTDTESGPSGDVDLVVHLTDDDLTNETGVGVGVEETRGAVSAQQLAAWIRRRAHQGGRVRVRTVLHTAELQFRGSRDGRCATSSTTGVGGATSSTTGVGGATSSTTGVGGATSSTSGPASSTTETTGTAATVAAWLVRHGIDAGITALQPIDLAADPAVDTHDPPPLMREQVVIRDAHCVFPGCRRDSRACDLDHLEPYAPPDDGRPPGQTRPSNLAPLCRRHHIAKTHHGWHYRRVRDGSFTWTSPTGHTYVVVPHGRAPLGQ